MASFTITGTIDGRAATLTWEDGEFTGDSLAIARVDELVRLGDTVAQTPTGPFYTAALEPAHVALVTASEAFDPGLELAGRVEFPDDEVPASATP